MVRSPAQGPRAACRLDSPGSSKAPLGHCSLSESALWTGQLKQQKLDRLTVLEAGVQDQSVDSVGFFCGLSPGLLPVSSYDSPSVSVCVQIFFFSGHYRAHPNDLVLT